MSSYLPLLENRYTDDLDEDAQEFIEFAIDGADRMWRMVDSLLEYSRISRSKSLEPTDASAVLDDVLGDLQLRIEETDATITTDDLPTVTADPDQLAQVFRNLILNALTYSRGEPPQVHVSAERTSGGWRFAVADEGIGVAPDYHDRISNVFERVPIDEGKSGSGAGGIGLALCERVIERHGGEIWVESEPGEGATFSFTIPSLRSNRQRPVLGSSLTADKTAAVMNRSSLSSGRSLPCTEPPGTRTRELDPHEIRARYSVHSLKIIAS